ncbi:MAG: PD-(D/E)XK nuclease family protein, partial [Clostridia bacterium]|nr:PD-(D/E)XK nuclease family protein [Clostridia bacterium]
AVLDEDDSATPTAPMRSKPKFMEESSTASAAERGTATHVFMQFCDFENVVENGVDAEIDRLIRREFIPESYGGMIRRDTIETFFASSLFTEMRASSDLRREVRFNICLPASDFTEDESLREELSCEEVLVQGVIDCFYTDAAGDIVIVDYKTDTFTDRQKEDRPWCEQTLRERHGRQLGYYRMACKRLLGKEPKKTLIYSFDLGGTVEI